MGDPGCTRPRRGDHYPLARRLAGRLHPLTFLKSRNPSNPALREAIVIPYHMRGARAGGRRHKATVTKVRAKRK